MAENNNTISQIQVGNVTYDIHDAEALPSNADDNYALAIKNQSNESNILTIGWDGTIETARDINTTDTSGIFTARSGITVAVFRFCQRGNVAAFYIGASKSTITAANTAITVGTIAAGRRPPFECAGPGTNGIGDAYISDQGVVSFRSTNQIAANARFYARVTYPVV